MSLDKTLLLTIGVLFVAAFVRSALGFGDALVAMPLLALVVGLQVATPVVAFAASTIGITILLSHWRSVDVRSTWRLVAASLVGIPFGLVLLKIAPEGYVKAALGLLLILYGLYSLLAPELPAVRGHWAAYVFGFVAGVLGGAYNTNGPPVVVYGALRHWSPEHFRATLQGCFLLTGLMILAGHGVAGLWTAQVLWLYLYSLPAIMLAIYLGARLNRRIPRETFSRAVYVFLVAMGALFLFG
jgi:uncharacterized protein